MGYEAALDMAWSTLQEAGRGKRRLQFLTHTLEVDPETRTIVPLNEGVTFGDFHNILFLHYLEGEDKVESIDNDEWVSFKDLSGGEIYYTTFRKRSVDAVLRKYSENASGIYQAIPKLNAQKINYGTAAVLVPVFPKIKVQIIVWERDDEFDAECSILFNSGIKEILPTEDVAVLAGIVAYSI